MDKVFAIICTGCNTNLELEGTQQEWAGTDIECPSCGLKIRIEAPAAPAGLLAGKKCPGCGEKMGAGAVLCVACGFDTRTGKRISGLGS